MTQKYIKSPLNYTGGKYKLLPQIVPYFPTNIDTFVDLFCGGANVGINIDANKIIYNDLNEYVIKLYDVFKQYEPEELIKKIDAVIDEYNLSQSHINGYEYYNCDSSHGLGSYNKPHFNKLKKDFNSYEGRDEHYYIMLYVLIIFGFNNQIRFNSTGEYNLPVGKRDFNRNIRKNLTTFVTKLRAQENKLSNKEFKNINITMLSQNDFVYCDPPYLITTATYNEQNGWTEQDEEELLDFLTNLDKQGVKFALSNVLTHKGKENVLLKEWSKNYHTILLEYNYNNSNYQAKNTEADTQEVLITNY